jgi:hypothetical protein
VIVIALVGEFAIVTAYVYVMTVKQLLATGVWVPSSVRVIARILLIVGAPGDVVYQFGRATFQFRELPRELTFSARVQRHIDKSAGWRHDKARTWGEFMNRVDPGHIKL